MICQFKFKTSTEIDLALVAFAAAAALTDPRRVQRRSWIREALARHHSNVSRIKRLTELFGDEAEARVKATPEWAIIDKANSGPIPFPSAVIAPCLGCTFRPGRYETPFKYQIARSRTQSAS